MRIQLDFNSFGEMLDFASALNNFTGGKASATVSAPSAPETRASAPDPEPEPTFIQDIPFDEPEPAPAPKTARKKPAPEPVPEPAPASEPANYGEMKVKLRALLADMNRSAPKGCNPAKQLIQSFGYDMLSDVPDSRLQELLDLVEGGKS